jgi:hypothetical protein
MTRLYGVMVMAVGMVGMVGMVACAGGQPAADTSAEASAWTYAPHSTLADVMRGIPFPSSNIVFDAQDADPAARPEPSETGARASVAYANVYGGWQGVEIAARVLSETANLIMIPGRFCENGLPVPLQDAAYRNAAEGLIAAGDEVYAAAKARNLDAMVDLSGTVADACANCHDIYRDVPEGEMRCVPQP